jgi:hypothetical protein
LVYFFIVLRTGLDDINANLSEGIKWMCAVPSQAPSAQIAIFRYHAEAMAVIDVTAT